jgi:hypothetical protein
MNADDLIDLWIERVQKGERVEMPWRPLRTTVFKGGTPEQSWKRMVEQFAARGVSATADSRGSKESARVWIVLSRLER